MIDDDDRVFAAVRARVESGEYLDDMLGLPGVNIEGGGAFQHADDGQLQRFCHWGSDEYVAARTAGQIQSLPPLAPAPEAAVRSCEALLGAPLPRLLRRCYLELGNGGFGPGYGLLGLSEEPATTGTAIGAWLQRQQHWPRPWPPIAASLLPICAGDAPSSRSSTSATPLAECGRWTPTPTPAAT